MSISDDRLSKVDWVRIMLERYERSLIGYALQITGDLDLARDVVQDTFLRLCTAKRSKVRDHIPAWLYKVCRNRALDVRRKEGRMQPLGGGQLEEYANGSAGPSTLAAQNEAHRLVLEAIKKLPEEQQEACRLKFNDDLTYREISRIMGKSLGTVSNLLTAALTTIRQRLRAKIDLAREG